jgi:hypothetical protein
VRLKIELARRVIGRVQRTMQEEIVAGAGGVRRSGNEREEASGMGTSMEGISGLLKLPALMAQTPSSIGQTDHYR